MRRSHILIALVALLTTLPLWAHGCSCGHDFDFHLQSWLDAAAQFRHGTLQPHWAFSAAYNAGEPRFIFYPPLSWMFGALLTFLFPIRMAPLMYTTLVLAGAGLAMHRLARECAPGNPALLAAALYVVNPYMLFTAFERTAYAELLAAVWLPLLLLAVLRKQPTVRGIALPVALLWLTNAPAAVMGCYALAVVVLVRAADALLSEKRKAPGERRPWLWRPAVQLASRAAAGTALGLLMASLYILPAAYERRYVQIAMAIIPNMRFQDNFLFGHTGDGPHDLVLHTASLLAVTVVTITAVLLVLAWALGRCRANIEGTREPLEQLPALQRQDLLIPMTALTVCIGFLLTPASSILWKHLPEFAFLQFPWRLLSVLAVVMALAAAIALRGVRMGGAITAVATLAVAAALTAVAIQNFRQPCDAEDLPAARALAFHEHQGVEPTDEYTPTQADNDVLRANDPPFWLSTNPAAFAPGTTPNPATLTSAGAAPHASEDAVSSPPDAEPATSAPDVLQVSAPRPEFLILNLRSYPDWRVLLNGHPAPAYRGDPRDDGLMVVPLPAGSSTVRVKWRRALDQRIGLILSGLGICVYGFLWRRNGSRKIEA